MTISKIAKLTRYWLLTLLCQEASRGSQCETEYCHCSWWCTRIRRVNPISKDTTHSGFRTQRNQAGTQLSASSLLTSSGKYSPGCWRRQVIYSVTRMWILHTKLLTCMARHAYWCNNCMNLLELTNHCLTETYSTERNPCLVLTAGLSWT